MQHVTSIYNLNEAEVVAKLIVKARQELRPWAEMVKVDPDHVNSLGDYEGIGLHLKLASLPLEHDGSVSEQTLARFQSEGEMFVDGLQASALNYTVLFSLFLTISISLLVMHAGEPAYSTETNIGAFHGPNGVHGNLTEAGISNTSRDAWADLASFAWPDSLETQTSLRRSLYAAECAFLGLSSFMFMCGVYEALLLFVAFGAGLPTVADKYLWVMENPWRLTHMWIYMFTCPVFMLFGIAFLTARSSAIASLAAAAVAICFMLFVGPCYQADFYSVKRHEKNPAKLSIGMSIMAAQKRAARRILAKYDVALSNAQRFDNDASSPPLVEATVVEPFGPTMA